MGRKAYEIVRLARPRAPRTPIDKPFEVSIIEHQWFSLVISITMGTTPQKDLALFSVMLQPASHGETEG
jgi:hypothetical protein